MESLKEQDQQLDRRIRDPDRAIHVLQSRHIDKNQLREALQEFASTCHEGQPESKRELLNVVIEEIRCSVKRREKTGEIVYTLRGDGTVMKNWEEAKQNEESGNPHDGGSTPRVVRLREQDSNLQPCGYGSSTAFAAGRTISSPMIRHPVSGTPLSGCRALVGLIGEILIP